MALKTANRLRHRQDFKNVYQKGRRRSGKILTVRALRASSADKASQKDAPGNFCATRIGISISQKVSKKAVVRNRIKRQIRAAFRQMLSGISPGWLVVVVVAPAACSCKYDEILRELEQLLAEAEVLDGHSRGSLL